MGKMLFEMKRDARINYNIYFVYFLTYMLDI